MHSISGDHGAVLRAGKSAGGLLGVFWLGCAFFASVGDGSAGLGIGDGCRSFIGSLPGWAGRASTEWCRELMYGRGSVLEC